MKRKIVGRALVLLVTVGLMAGCGKNESTEDIAVIQSGNQSGNAVSEIYDAASQYAVDNGMILKEHTAASNDPDDYMVSIQEAAEAGATCIIGYGEDFEIPLYTMQRKYKKVKFIIVDGAPRSGEGEKETLRKNTVAITFNDTQAGFLAGYAAVQDGYRSLGYMGGKKQDITARYGSGFVQGAEYAASELGLGSDEVTVRYTYLDTSELSPAVMSEASSWYQDGCEVIFAGGGSIGTAIMKAAEQTDTKMISSDTVLISDQQAVLTAAVKNINDLVYEKIDSVFKKEFEGKKVEVMDVSNGGISLQVEGSQLQSFTADAYDSLVGEITDETIPVEDKYVSQLNKDGALSHISLQFD